MSDLDINLVEELGLDKLSEEKRAEVIAALTKAMEDRLNVRLMKELSWWQTRKLDKVLNDPNGDLAAFFKKNIPNLDAIRDEVIGKFKKDMVDVNKLTNEVMENMRKR